MLAIAAVSDRVVVAGPVGAGLKPVRTAHLIAGAFATTVPALACAGFPFAVV